MVNQTSQTVAFKKGERNIFLHILTACNLSCRHCYINPEQHGESMISRKTMDNWLQLFFDPSQETNVVFLGGEPTLHPDLAHGIKTAVRLGYHSVTVDSNGFLFHHLLDKITPADAVLSFSLDGPTAAVNDPIRGKGSFDACTDNLRRAVDMGFKTSVIYTVNRLNIDQLDNMPELLDKLGANHFFIQVVGIRGRSVQNQSELQITPERWLSVVPPIAAHAAALGLEVFYPKVFLNPGEPFECAGNVAENYFIFPNGRVYRCPLCEDFPVNAFRIEQNQLCRNHGLTEEKFFTLNIPEGCVMNKLLQPGNLLYDKAGRPLYRISCCLLKQKVNR